MTKIGRPKQYKDLSERYEKMFGKPYKKSKLAKAATHTISGGKPEKIKIQDPSMRKF